MKYLLLLVGLCLAFGQGLEVEESGGHEYEWMMETVEERIDEDNEYDLELRMAVYYDKQFLDRFKDNAENVVNKVVENAQKLFKRRDQLGYSIKLEVTERTFIDRSISIDDISDLENSGVYKKYLNNVANMPNAFIFLSNKEINEPLATGIYVADAVCFMPKKGEERYYGLRVAVAEFHQNSWVSGANLAHELGHMLNIGHDFNLEEGNRVPRFAKNGKDCTAQKGVMNYSTGPDFFKGLVWSHCSKDDFGKYMDAGRGSCLLPGKPDGVEFSGPTA